ncbi:hypothetical protein CAP39_05225 [Sphingomonas sp. IBVSS1]|nr:hypothetical protein CAP39_05225 [Sphingomonas sp. IBVSS1]
MRRMTPPVREGTPAAVHASPIADGLHPRLRPNLRPRVQRGLVIGVAASLVLAFTGAFRTDQIALLPRLGYWFSVVMAGSMLGLLITAAVQAWGRLARWYWLEMAFAALLISLPLTFIVVVASVLCFGQFPITPATLAGFFTAVFPVSLVMTIINMSTAPQVSPPTAEPEPPPAPPAAPPPVTMPAALAERLPARLRAGRLLALAAEDHYLRVHTDLGNDLVLMRMADAVALLAEVPGARVHRSWWVARAAVTGTNRDGDRLFLTLETGLSAPVSRAERARLTAAGWLQA